MAVIGDTLPHCTGTGTEADPYKFTTQQGFLEAIAVEYAYVEANSSNLVFDCNDGVITAPIEIYNKSFDGKNLTILNGLIQNTNSPVIDVKTSSGEIYIQNTNFYNVCVINYNYMHTVLEYHGSTASGNIINITNCNFTGIIIGYPNDGTGIIYYNKGGSDYYHRGNRVTNTTFNFNFKDPTNNTTNTERFIAGISDNDNERAVFKNCTFKFSGKLVRLFQLTRGDREQFNNCTFLNDEKNPLIVKDYSMTTLNNAAYSGYNYYKMYINASGTIWIYDNLGLVNISRLTAYTLSTSNSIEMQETNGPSLLSTEPADWSTNWTDYFTKSGNNYIPVTGDTAPTFTTNTYYSIPTDYIYCDANLEAKGFLVGQVIS